MRGLTQFSDAAHSNFTSELQKLRVITISGGEFTISDFRLTLSVMSLLTHRSAGWEIRPHTRDDRAGIKRVYDICMHHYPWQFSPDQSAESLEYALSYTSALVAIVPGAGVVGFMILNSETGFVSHLFVEPDWRFCGIGSGLLEVGKVLTARPLQQQLDVRNRIGRAACAAMGWTEMVSEGGSPGWQIRLIAP